MGAELDRRPDSLTHYYYTLCSFARATAVIAQSLAGIAYCPIDIVKQTVQTATVVQGKESRMANPIHATKTIWNAQGIKGFYRGFVAMNCLWMP